MSKFESLIQDILLPHLKANYFSHYYVSLFSYESGDTFLSLDKSEGKLFDLASLSKALCHRSLSMIALLKICGIAILGLEI